MTDLIQCPQRFIPGQEGDHWRADRTCSYCGSSHPDDLMADIESGDAKLVPTDKNSKVYVQHRDGRYHKFYLAHLSQEQRLRFIELYNERRMRLAEPGHFYVLPFFCKVES